MQVISKYVVKNYLVGSNIYILCPNISGHSKICDFANVFVTNQNISRG